MSESTKKEGIVQYPHPLHLEQDGRALLRILTVVRRYAEKHKADIKAVISSQAVITGLQPRPESQGGPLFHVSFTGPTAHSAPVSSLINQELGEIEGVNPIG